MIAGAGFAGLERNRKGADRACLVATGSPASVHHRLGSLTVAHLGLPGYFRMSVLLAYLLHLRVGRLLGLVLGPWADSRLALRDQASL